MFGVDRHLVHPEIESSLIRSSLIRAWQWDIREKGTGRLSVEQVARVRTLDPKGRSLVLFFDGIKGFSPNRPITGRCGLIKVQRSTTRQFGEEVCNGGFRANTRSWVSRWSSDRLVGYPPSMLAM